MLLSLYFVLVSVRFFRRQRRQFKAQIYRFTFSRKWLLLPIADQNQLGVTEMILDAVTRLPAELTSPNPVPTLLAIRPVKGEAFEPEIWYDYRVEPAALAREIEGQLADELKLHEFDLVDAVQDLQIKLGSLELGNIAKFFRSFSRWFTAGAPTVSGSVLLTDRLTDGTKEVTVRLSRAADGVNFASVAASTVDKSATEAANFLRKELYINFCIFLRDLIVDQTKWTV